MWLVLITGITIVGRTAFHVYSQVLSRGALPQPTDKGCGLASRHLDKQRLRALLGPGHVLHFICMLPLHALPSHVPQHLQQGGHWKITSFPRNIERRG